MYDQICIMVPTYGRAHTMLPILIESCLGTSVNKPSLNFCFCINKNDPDTEKYLKSVSWPAKVFYIYENLQNPNLAVFYNMMYKTTECLGKNCVVSMIGDDMEFKSCGWDREILAIINQYNGIGVFWCNDNYIAREKLCVNLFVTRKMVEATEHQFMDERFPGDMIDVVWYDIGRLTKSLHFLPNVIIQHNHNTRQPKEKWDNTFNRLAPARKQGHRLGKSVCLETAQQIANILVRKGYVGDNK